MSRFQLNRANRLLLIHLGILAAFALIPVWYRLPATPPLFPSLYVSRFLILLPMLWSIVWWLVLGLPGFNMLRQDTLRAGWALALLLLALWALASPLWAFQRIAHPDVGQSAALQFGVVALFAIVVACAAPPRRMIVGTLVVGVLWSSIITIGQVVNQGSIGLRALGEFPLGVNQPGIGYIQVGDARWLRPYGLLPHPNMLAGFFAIGLLAATVWFTSRQRLLVWAGILIFTLGLWGLLLTFSRGAWIGFAAGVFAILPLLIRDKAKLVVHGPLLAKNITVPSVSLWFKKFLSHSRLPVLILVFLVVALPFALIFRPFLAARVGVGGESIELRSISDRVVFTTFAYDSIIERPIIGVGIGNFPWRASFYLANTNYDLRGDNVHQVLVSAWAELGLVGLVLLVAALVLGTEAVLKTFTRGSRHEGAKGERAVRPSDNGDTLARIALFGGFITLTALGLLDHYPWTIIQFQVAWWGLLAASLKPRAERPNQMF
jgi:O-antigen ligase